MQELEELLRDHQDVLSQSLAESILAGWFGGAEHAAAQAASVLESLPPLDAGFGQPPVIPPGAPPASPEFEGPEEWPGLERSIRSLVDRRIISPAEYYGLSAAAKSQAFTISGEITQDTIARIHELLAENVGGTANRESFIRAVREAVDRLPISDSHLEHVYRNAANQAYTEGQDHVLDHPLVADAFPYRAYFAIHDHRARSTHRDLEKLGLSGTNVYHKDDPTWLRFKPPWGWNCRCGWAPLSIRDAARLGVQEAIEWLKTGIEPVHVWVKPPPFAPDPSWERLVV